MTLPEAEAKLSSHLGDRYKDDDWQPALKAVMDSEGDVLKAQKAIQDLAAACEQPRLTIRIPATRPPQLVTTENELIASVERLQSKNGSSESFPQLKNSQIPHMNTRSQKSHPMPFLVEIWRSLSKLSMRSRWSVGRS